MVEVLTTLLIASGIIFFGFFTEFLFDRFKIPDVLLLIILGFVLGSFKVEKDIIYISPYPYVRNVLQKNSAYKFLESYEVYDYCRKFLRFAESTIPKGRLKLIKPLKEIINKRKTVSDELPDYARKRGFRKNEAITNKLGAEMALAHSKRLLKEIILTRNMIKFNLDNKTV